MLVLSRRVGEQIKIGDNISITVSRVRGDRVSIAIEAPPEIRILRSELEEAINVSLSFESDFDHTLQSVASTN